MNGLYGRIPPGSDELLPEQCAAGIALERTAAKAVMMARALVGSPWDAVRNCGPYPLGDLCKGLVLRRTAGFQRVSLFRCKRRNVERTPMIDRAGQSEMISQQRARKDRAESRCDGQDVCLAAVVTGHRVAWQQIGIEFVPIRVVNQILDAA